MIEVGPQSFEDMRKADFLNDNYYHIYNRGADKRQIFSDNLDYVRFIHYLYEFNDSKNVFNCGRNIDGGPTSIIKERDALVEIVTFCLMPNHFHLILKQLKDGGITKFMRKLGTGYAMYFNQKNKRNGVLFQGKFKAIPIENDNYLIHLSRYIHINPIEFTEPDWKTKGIKNWDEAGEFLKHYRWSSYLDYIGIKNFPSIINKNVINSLFSGESSYENFIGRFVGGDSEVINNLILE